MGGMELGRRDSLVEEVEEEVSAAQLLGFY
jgi:hypothetical protein